MREPFSLPRAITLVVALLAGCDGAPPGLAPGVSFLETGDLTSDLAEIKESVAALPTAAGAAAPWTIYLWYSDGTPYPMPHGCGALPPFTCRYGGAEGVEGCKKKIQGVLDLWYHDFNVVFTTTRPTAGPYYTVLISSRPGGGIAGTATGFTCGNAPAGVACVYYCLDGKPGGNDAKYCATIIAQEHAHLVGLAHTSSSSDVMLGGHCMERGPTCDGFENKDSPSTPCRGTQNSYKLMLSTLGPWPGGEKPGPFGPSGGESDAGAGGAAGAAGAGGAGGAAGAGGQGGEDGGAKDGAAEGAPTSDPLLPGPDAGARSAADVVGSSCAAGAGGGEIPPAAILTALMALALRIVRRRRTH